MAFRFSLLKWFLGFKKYEYVGSILQLHSQGKDGKWQYNTYANKLAVQDTFVYLIDFMAFGCVRISVFACFDWFVLLTE